jgi:CRISP-associated protein Cas1
MSRPLCDPIDLENVLSSLQQDAISVSNAYQEYASTAARPYAPKTFYQIVVAAKRNRVLAYGNKNVARKQPQLDNATLDRISNDYWLTHLRTKPGILTTICDNTLLNVRAKSLIVKDGDIKLTYSSSAANKPKAIVMTGWSGLVSIEAMRFCHDNDIAIVMLDWSRNFLSIVAPPASQSARLIRAQCAADPASVAREIVRQKLAAYVSVGALPTEQGRTYSHNVDTTQSISALLGVEALAARMAWKAVPSIQWRSGGPPIPPAWKLPYGARGRYGRGSPRNAIHPVNAMLNVAFAVTVGRLAAFLTAQGLCASIGFLHADTANRYSLAYDTIEPIRPLIERRVFEFIRGNQFAANDFIMMNDGSIKLTQNLRKLFLDKTAAPIKEIDSAVESIKAVIVRYS